MKLTNLLSAFLGLVVLSSNAQVEVNLEERYELREETEADRAVKPKPYNGKYSSARGGGGISSTDCYSFVPVPDDAIELDNDDSDFGNSLDGAWGPFPLDFSFCHFGDYYDQFYVNMKGNITFDNFNTTFVPAGFPSNDFAMVSGYWADIDLRCADCGTVYYWTTPTAAYITFWDVGYYNNHGNLNNTFQIVITNQNDDVVGLGNNVGLFYQDMQWAAGDWNGGNAGFGGDAAGTVGANKNDGQNFIQFGRFLYDTDDYDGPFGTEDGVHWLDDKAFVFNICSTTDNIPPIPNNPDACDTIFICQNDTYDFNVSFLPPEGAQTVTVTVDDSQADGWTETDSGDAYMEGVFTGGADNVGVHTLVFTGTDNGTPEGVTTITYNIEVVNTVLPDLTISGDGLLNDVVSYCGGQPGAEITASDGFDSYFWSNDTEGQSTFLPQGEQNLVAVLDGCEAEYGPISVFAIPSFNPDIISDSFFVCEGETTTLEVDEPDQYSDILWSVVNNNGNILTADLNSPEVEVEEGTYLLSVTDDIGCEGFRNVSVGIEEITPVNLNGLFDCGEKEIQWSGASADPDDCLHFIYLYDSDGDTWEGAYIEAYVDDTGPLIYTIPNAATFSPQGTSAVFGQTITYEFFGGLDDDDIRVQIYNCENDLIFDSDLPGDELTEGVFFTQVADTEVNPLYGSWTQEPDVGTLSNTDVFNPLDGTQTYTVPDDFLGTVTLTFQADICPFSESYDLLFSLPLEVSDVPETLSGCSEDGVLIEPTFFPSEDVDPITYNWSPNLNCEGNPSCTVNTSIDNLCIEGENTCESDEQCVDVTITPTPTANLENLSICEDSQVLNPGPSDASFVYNWTTGESTPTITVTASGTYDVTVTNSCGTASASSQTQFFDAPVVDPWVAVDTLICPGETVDFDPNWQNFSGDITWAMNWTDGNGNAQTQTFSETGPVLTFGSDQIPFDAAASSVNITYSNENFCGSANGLITAYTDACFIAATNVFSPDNDGGEDGQFNGGLNEAWYIVGIDAVSGVEVKVYDRWGGIVYENDSYSNDDPWTGVHTNGSDLSDGVYFYTIKTPRGNQEIQGTVTILRKK